MKKLFLLATLFMAICVTASAQGGPERDPAVMKQKMKERTKPQLIEKTKITDEQAEKVLDIYVDAQRQRREIRTDASLGEEEKTKKQAAIEEETTKKFKAIPLKDDEVIAVNSFFEEMRKNSPRRKESGNK